MLLPVTLVPLDPMRLPPFSFAVLDTETTGFVPRVHHVIEYAAIRAEGGEITDTYEQLFSVKEQIPPHVQVLTRIKQEMLVGKPTFEELRPVIEQKLDGLDILVGQNLSFDIGMIRGEGIDLSERAWVDTSMLASLVFPEFRSFSLQYMSARLNLTHEPAHRALGDVRATLELFVRIWERLLELPPDQLAFAKDVMGKCAPGYKILFEALPEGTSKKASWIQQRVRHAHTQKNGHATLTPPPVGTVELHEEGLSPGCLQQIINGIGKDGPVRWIAVKNLESSLKRLQVPETLTILHPPQLLLNPEAGERLKAQESFLPEEALLLLKLEWFHPRTRNDIALHGGEKDLWNGKIACAATSAAYSDQFSKRSAAFLLDHRQLLSFLADPAHAAHGTLTDNAHIIVDDASMLEDTATKAYGHFIALDDMRAAAGGSEPLTRLTDLLAIFLETIRGGEDQYFLAPADLRRSEAKSLQIQAQEFLKQDLPEKTREQLTQALALLEENLPEKHIIWIERRLDGALTLQSAPKHVDTLLDAYLYSRYATTLLVPKGSNGVLPEIVPEKTPKKIDSGEGFSPCALSVSFPTDQTITSFLQHPLPGKTIMLAGSKRVIEQAFITHTEHLEEEGVTLICQGLSGGQGRMESEFITAHSPAILMVTPFMYEGLDFPEGTADRLILDQVPFDHPNHPVMSKRKDRYRNAFMEYCVPRVEYRLFRLMRTFCRHRREDAEMMVFDRRLVEKDYGARLQRLMAQCATAAGPIIEAPAPSISRSKPAAKAPKKPKEKAPPKKKKDDGQLQLPL